MFIKKYKRTLSQHDQLFLLQSTFVLQAVIQFVAVTAQTT